jgi:hypothetical protein
MKAARATVAAMIQGLTRGLHWAESELGLVSVLGAASAIDGSLSSFVLELKMNVVWVTVQK